jgi:hypothetical protein
MPATLQEDRGATEEIQPLKGYLMTINIHLNKECDFPNAWAVLCVTDYETGSYDGWGNALTLMADGSVKEWNLSHCSCYEPFDKSTEQWPSVEAFRRDLENVTATEVSAKLTSRFLTEADKLTPPTTH